MSSKMVFAGIHGQARMQLLRLHRLEAFERVFSAYLAGKAPASLVKQRAAKMLEVGLPKLK